MFLCAFFQVIESGGNCKILQHFSFCLIGKIFDFSHKKGYAVLLDCPNNLI